MMTDSETARQRDSDGRRRVETTEMRRLHDLCDGQGLDWAGPRGSGEDGVHEPMRYLAGVLQGVRQLHPAKIYFARLVWINPFSQEIVIGTATLRLPNALDRACPVSQITYDTLPIASSNTEA